MEFSDLINKRRSVRVYQRKGVDDEVLRCIIDAANKAPSAGNLQAYKIYAVQDPIKKEALARAAYEQEFIADAPIVLVFCALPERSEWRYRERGANLYCIQDATIACTFAMLAATDTGLGSVWVGAFSDEEVRVIIDVPNGVLPVAILPIGYMAESPRYRSRRDLSELVHYL